VRNGDLPEIHKLIELVQKDNGNTYLRESLINYRDKDNKSALHWALSEEEPQRQMIPILKKYGADDLARDNQGRTPISIATEQGILYEVFGDIQTPGILNFVLRLSPTTSFCLSVIVH